MSTKYLVGRLVNAHMRRGTVTYLHAVEAGHNRTLCGREGASVRETQVFQKEHLLSCKRCATILQARERPRHD